MSKKLFLMALIAVLCMGLGIAMIACSAKSGDDDDDDNDTSFDDDATADDDDDDDNDDNDTSADDDTSGDDDDDTSAGYTCADIADTMLNICGLALSDIDGVQLDQAGTENWCTLCDGQFSAKLDSPFWNCMGGCLIDDTCNQDCANACFTPADPGSGCGSTTHGIYSCGVVFIFNAPNDNLFVPESDEQLLCASDDAAVWECFAGCVTDNPCSEPPTSPEANALIACMNGCTAK